MRKTKKEACPEVGHGKARINRCHDAGATTTRLLTTAVERHGVRGRQKKRKVALTSTRRRGQVFVRVPLFGKKPFKPLRTIGFGSLRNERGRI